jgi:ABC-type enterochelin transport system substrate-binding protein
MKNKFALLAAVSLLALSACDSGKPEDSATNSTQTEYSDNGTTTVETNTVTENTQ